MTDILQKARNFAALKLLIIAFSVFLVASPAVMAQEDVIESASVIPGPNRDKPRKAR